LKEAVELMKKNTWAYAKRQMTWFKKDKEIHWFQDSKELEKLSVEK
jgi:tRNA dimethylallyltransferase